jgi:DNA-binding SARP family transcriptional activator/tetratricopeptide (TPR) repeat protein
MRVEFRLLGDVEAAVDGRAVDLGYPQQRCVLTVLVLEANRPVTADQLLDRAWGGPLPQRSRNALSSYVSRLRQVFAVTDEVAIVFRSGAYMLHVDPLAADVHRFRDLVTRARMMDDPEGAVAVLEEALRMWHGEAFATLSTPWLDTVRQSLDGERFAAVLDRNDLALELGLHAEYLADIAASAASNPLDERLAGQLIHALYRCGRQSAAFEHYQRVRLHLAEELGTDPSASLQRLHQRMLTADPALAGPGWPVGRRVGLSTSPVPRQLPAPTRLFSGREPQIAQLDALLTGAGDAPAAVVVAALSGTAGIGKTALAVHWAHRVAERFSDGQLYVNLRGFAPDAHTEPADAIRGFLDALGVPPPRIPTGFDAQVALYRSMLADKQMLIVIDNARDAEHVRPLLPGAPGCLVIVTSRNELTGLVVTEVAQPVRLDVLTHGEARQLLARRLGPARTAAEPDAVDDIIAQCARLPLALAVVAARAAAHPDFPLAEVAAQLGQGLDAFSAGDSVADVRVVLSWSYQALTAPAARLFQLLGLHPGPDIGAPAAASLAGVSLAGVRQLLAELTGAHLLNEHAPGRYAFHDLLRAYAVEKAGADQTAAERRQAVQRILDHYLHTAHAASQLVDSYRGDLVTLRPAEAGVTAEYVDDSDQAMAWFTAERPALVALVEQAARDRFETYTWQLAWTLAEYLQRRGYWREVLMIQKVAASAAERVGDKSGQALAYGGLGGGYTGSGRHAGAEPHLWHALKLYRELGNHIGEATTHRNLGVCYEQQGRYRDALNHAERALALFRAAGYTSGAIRALNSVGWRHALLGDYEQAHSYCEQAIPLYQKTGDRLGEAATWDSLGYIHHHLGEHKQAIACYQRALDMFRDIGHRYMEANTLRHLGDTHTASHAADAAASAWRQALEILDQLGHHDADLVRTKLGASSLEGESIATASGMPGHRLG